MNQIQMHYAVPCLQNKRRSEAVSSTPNMGPMDRIQVYHLQVPQIKNRTREKENASPVHSFSNAHSKSMLPVRAPPIAPARSRQLLDCTNSNDWTGADVDYGWPD